LQKRSVSPKSAPNMALERTLSIIKPDAMEKNKAGAILARLEEEGFVVKAMKRLHLTRAEAEGFYAEHRGRGFFEELVAFMSRSPILVMALEREDAVARYREVIGANVGENAVHGSDKASTAAREIAYFFAGYEVAPAPPEPGRSATA
jgi:nucleoside-diphosphate kinase